MTPAQKTRFYLPAWTAAWRANWHMVEGRVTALPNLPPNEFRDTVAAVAAELCAKEDRLPKADDIRRACTFVATKKHSSKGLNTAQTNRLVSLLKLLVNPENLAAMVGWTSPQQAADQALDARLRKFPQAYAEQISYGKFGTIRYMSLSHTQKSHLLWTLNNRNAVNATKV
jgi:hypothetical protein